MLWSLSEVSIYCVSCQILMLPSSPTEHSTFACTGFHTTQFTSPAWACFSVHQRAKPSGGCEVEAAARELVEEGA
jgi:hypothetical protein